MKVGSIVKTVECFEELSKIWSGVNYPKKGDILTVKKITKHPNKECDNKGIVMLHFKELDNSFGICDKQINGKLNFLELQISDNKHFKVGDKVIKNKEKWEVNDFDSWGRGIGVGIIVEPPFEMDEGEVDVRWEGGRCFEFTHQLLKISNSDEI